MENSLDSDFDSEDKTSRSSKKSNGSLSSRLSRGHFNKSHSNLTGQEELLQNENKRSKSRNTSSSLTRKLMINVNGKETDIPKSKSEFKIAENVKNTLE